MATPNGHSWKSLDDGELVALAQRGDDTAFAELLSRHRTSCFRTALSILRHREDAEDEVQNAFWKAYQNIGQFQQEAKFSTWLTRIVVNQCLMKFRKDKRARFLHLDDVQIGEETGTLELRDNRETPEEALGATEVQSVVSTEIRRLPSLLKNPLVLRDVDQLPMPEVASRLGVTVAAAKSRLLRARRELRNRLDRHTGRLGAATLLAQA